MTYKLMSLCLIALTVGCNTNGPGDAIEKAQIAVRANPSLELVATDERQSVLTVKVKRSGRIMTVRVADVVAGTAFRDLDTDSLAAQPPTQQRVDISGAAGQVSVTRSGSGLSVSAPTGTANPQAKPSERQRIDVSGPAGQVSVTRSGNGVAVETDGRQVTVGGSGSQVTVETGSRPRETATPDRRASGTGLSTSPSNSTGRGAVIDDSRLERRTRPISCGGANSEDLSNVLLQVTEVAVDSAGACTVRIKNSHIVGDVAIKGTGSTTLSIENSIIEGRVALQLRDSTTVSVRSSTIQGTVQKSGSVTVQDLGGNLWR